MQFGLLFAMFILNGILSGAYYSFSNVMIPAAGAKRRCVPCDDVGIRHVAGRAIFLAAEHANRSDIV